VEFGDGQTGVRLPTGQENVVATYRKGMGEEGLVRPRQLALLVTRPLGVRGVTNPMGAADAAPAEGLAEVRENAALPLLSLDRVVSLRDYEDFARAFSGIAKALATWTWDGRRRGVFLTVAGARGAEVTPGTQTYLNLSTAIRRASPPVVRVVIATYRSAFFQVKAKVKVDPSFHTATVLAAVDATLHAAFAFERRAFGQPVSTSEIALIVHAVPGVVAVDIDALFRPGEAELPNPVVTADLTQSGIAEPLAAQLLLLDPRPVALGVMS
jgi:predicted phage baseplate assembly protein